MQKQIFLREALKQMSSYDADGYPVKFDLTVREFNSQNKTGGSLKVYKDVKMVMPTKNKNIIQSLKHKKINEAERVRKNPNHFDNRTRNIKLPDGAIRKINILLIIEFNGQKVIY